MSDFVLVPGGMLGGWCWGKVCQYLNANNHRAFPITLTGLGERKHLANPSVGLKTHVEDVVNMILCEDLRDIILVGHSYGGMIITGVADQMPGRIKKLVYFEALLPKDGESLCDTMGSNFTKYFTNLVNERGDGWLVPHASADAYGFTDPEIREWFMSRVTAHPFKSFQDKLYLKNDVVGKIPTVYIKGTRDAMMDVAFHRAQKMGIECLMIDSDHFAMVGAPKALGELLSIQ